MIAIVGEIGCHSEDTEVVTPKGIKTYRELRIGDEVMGINQFMEIQPTKIKKIFEYDYNDKMIHFKSKRYDFLVTPNHRMIFKSDGQKDFIYKRADKIIKEKKRGRFVNSFFQPEKDMMKTFKIGKNEYPIDKFMFLVGFYIGDGCVLTSKGNDKYRYIVLNKPFKVIKNIKKIVESMDISCGIYEKRKLAIFDLVLSKYIIDNCGRGAKNKVIPDELLNLHPTHLKYLFDGLMASDGSRNQRYYSISKQLIDKFIILCLKLGFLPCWDKKKIRNKSIINGRKINQNYPCYDVGISFKPNGIFSPIETKDNHKCYEIINYSGKVWCFETELGNFFTTRNGKVGVSGNSGKTLCLTYLAWRKYLKGLDVFSNYHLKFPPYPNGMKSPRVMYIKNINDVLAMQSGYACLDELWNSLDSRMSGSKKNKLVSQILLKSRKREIHIGYTTQSFHQVDKRIRDTTSFIAEPRLNSSETICRLQIRTLPSREIMKIYRFPTADIFRLYDTREEVGSLFGDDDESRLTEINKDMEDSKKDFLDDEPSDTDVNLMDGAEEEDFDDKADTTEPSEETEEKKEEKIKNDEDILD